MMSLATSAIRPSQTESALGSARERLWLLLSPVAIGMPFALLESLDGFAGDYPVWKIVFFFSSSWVLHALPFILIAGVLELIRLPFKKYAAFKSLFDQIVLVVARVSVLVVLGVVARYWYHAALSPVAIPISGAKKVILILTMVIGVCFYSFSRRPKLGAFLESAKQLSRVSAVAVTALMCLEAGLSGFREITSEHVITPVRGETSSRADVILITIDAFSARHLSIYGYAVPTSPALADFVRTATVFDRFYAASNFTIPTTDSLLYGVRPWTHRATGIPSHPIHVNDMRNLIREFKRSGYRTMAVSTNEYASPDRHYVSEWLDDYSRSRIATPAGYLYRLENVWSSLSAGFAVGRIGLIDEKIQKIMVKMGLVALNHHYDPEIALDEARNLWVQPTTQPRFLWIHLLAPHDPYATPAPFLGSFEKLPIHLTQFDSTPPSGFSVINGFSAIDAPDFPQGFVGRYDEGILMTDQALGGFFKWLNRRHELSSSTIVLTADHGESFRNDYGQHSGPLLTEELVHLPLVIKQSYQQTGRRLQTLASQIDVTPTVLHMAGIASDSFEGRVLPLETEDDFSGPVYSMSFERTKRRRGPLDVGTVALFRGPWKYVHYYGYERFNDIPKLTDQLFDLQHDPDEHANRLTSEPALAAAMRKEIETALHLHGQALH